MSSAPRAAAAPPAPDRRALAVAALASAVFVLWAPFIGEVRALLDRSFPRAFVPGLGIAVAAIAGLALAAAVWRIRTGRLWRIPLLLSSLALVGIYIVLFSTGQASVDAVERIHFLQYGLVAWLFYRALRPINDTSIFLLTVLAGAVVGTAEEWVQWVAPTRVGEARDVLLDTYAAACGLLFGVAIRPPRAAAWRPHPVSWRRLRNVAVFGILFFAAFYDRAHLGYTIWDDEIGEFRSYFTRQELLAASADRAVTWAADPPRGLPVIGVEDYYLTEAAWHVQYRNAGYANRDFRLAWYENRILEKYYAPFLELSSFMTEVRHGWPAAQRDEVDAAIPARMDGLHRSPAGVERIRVTPSHAEYWMAILLFAAVAWTALELMARRAERGEDVPKNRVGRVG